MKRRSCEKLLSDPLYAQHSFFGEDLVGIQTHKDHILMNRSVYKGMCVLELSKTLMYEELSGAQVRLKLTASLHRHRLSPPRDQDRRCLQRHGRESGLLRHERLSERPPFTQPKKIRKSSAR